MIHPQGPSLRRRIVGLYGLLIGANLAAWVWAYTAFSDNPTALGTAFLAYAFGLRHAVDPDHIAAIDNVTRKVMQDGKRPMTVGLWFALGHSSTVVLAAIAIALMTTSLAASFEGVREVGALIGTTVSAVFLLLIGLLNLVILGDVWRSFQRARRDGNREVDGFDKTLPGGGILARVLSPLFRLISRSWHMYPLGFLFALGFDTTTEVSLLGMSAAEAGRGSSLWQILVFPTLFTAAMTLVDTTDGILMLGAYGWAYVKPARKLFYNLIITFTSAIVALLIGGLEALHLVNEKLALQGVFWNWVEAVNENFGALGFAIIGLFAAAWMLSVAFVRFSQPYESKVRS
ncbi:HoxN/HupN/NixA family nickel/cobalt transporter [Methylobacterium sp. E-045]|uniref:HoxN/HupN/NixA family nickel/cobalt transporter n=1 Tax=Methylobacterium sp. E-045 TaxID=2836575 RepID=UPI001FBBE35F|nr:HoxN/HupN/NixA family nickel/cobalt transporter [Methylobacterium sp. E-045]MCJ2128206.1 HoxN/HupN/NixA family nickel/cobalt transporter [Methylobacterium sp. E-045]